MKTMDGAIDGPSFLAYVEQVLAPTLHQGDNGIGCRHPIDAQGGDQR
jgi:hypothetical protein